MDLVSFTEKKAIMSGDTPYHHHHHHHHHHVPEGLGVFHVP